MCRLTSLEADRRADEERCQRLEGELAAERGRCAQLGQQLTEQSERADQLTEQLQKQVRLAEPNGIGGKLWWVGRAQWVGSPTLSVQAY